MTDATKNKQMFDTTSTSLSVRSILHLKSLSLPPEAGLLLPSLSKERTTSDITYVAFYGECEELVRVQGAPEDKTYDWCHKFATANVVARV